MKAPRFGESAATLWSDPLDRRLALAVIRDLVTSEKSLSGLIDHAHQVGLYPKLATWIGTDGENQTFTADDIKRLLGDNSVTELATETQAAQKEVVYRLAHIVPQIVGRVLPAGEINSPDVERVGLEAIRSNILSSAR